MTIGLPDFEQAQVLVLGDLMLDRYWHGPTGRISPEAPVPVVKVEQIEDRPGGAANVALNIAALGSQCKIIGITGNDEAGKILTDKLEGLTISTDFYELSAVTNNSFVWILKKMHPCCQQHHCWKNSNQVSNLHQWLSCLITPRVH